MLTEAQIQEIMNMELPEPSDTHYWQLKALQTECETFVNKVFDDYHIQTILDYVQKALYDAEMGNLKP